DRQRGGARRPTPGGTPIAVAAAVIVEGAAAVASQEAYASSRSVSRVARAARPPFRPRRSYPLAWRVMIELESFICERQLLDGNVIARGIEVGRLAFDRQRPLEHPRGREPPFPVMELDPHILARRGRGGFELRRAYDDARRKAADADDDELGGPKRRKSHHQIDDALIGVLPGRGRGIAAHEKRLLRL